MASILVAEDNGSLMRLLDSVLTSAGHRVITADDAIMAAELAEESKEPIDVLCVHVAMARTSGAVLAERMRKRFPEMKVLFIITENPHYFGIDTPEVCQENSAYCVIKKPFTCDQLVAKVEELIKTSASSVSGPA